MPLGSGMKFCRRGCGFDSDAHTGHSRGGRLFTTGGGGTANRIALWNGSAWLPLGAGFNDEVYSLSVLGSGDLVAGGLFTTAEGAISNHIARWSGAFWTPMDNGLNAVAYVQRVLSNGMTLAVGGAFTTADNLTSNRIARWRPGPGQGTSPLVYAVPANRVKAVAAALRHGFPDCIEQSTPRPHQSGPRTPLRFRGRPPRGKKKNKA